MFLAEGDILSLSGDSLRWREPRLELVLPLRRDTEPLGLGLSDCAAAVRSRGATPFREDEDMWVGCFLPKGLRSVTRNFRKV